MIRSTTDSLSTVFFAELKNYNSLFQVDLGHCSGPLMWGILQVLWRICELITCPRTRPSRYSTSFEWRSRLFL